MFGSKVKYLIERFWKAFEGYDIYLEIEYLFKHRDAFKHDRKRQWLLLIATIDIFIQTFMIMTNLECINTKHYLLLNMSFILTNSHILTLLYSIVYLHALLAIYSLFWHKFRYTAYEMAYNYLCQNRWMYIGLRINLNGHVRTLSNILKIGY